MKNKTKIGVIVLVLLIAIGFATVTTNLIINGTSRVAASDISGLVYFSYAHTDTAPGASADRSNNNTEITFVSKKLTDIGDTATLDYTVYNDSSQYDANVVMSIQMPTNQPGVTWSDYVDITYTGFQPAEQGNDHHVTVDGKGSQNGKIEITLKKLSTEDITIEFIITLDVTAVERTSEATTAAPGPGPAPTCNRQDDGKVAYFDPVSSNECSRSTFNASNVAAGTSTCYAWRVVSHCGDEYTLQLDHSVGNSVWINQTDYNTAATAGSKTNHWVVYQGAGELGPITALKTLESATTTWTRVDPITYSYSNVIDIATPNVYDDSDIDENYGVLNCNNGVCSVSNNSTYTFTTALRARLLTYEEVVAAKGGTYTSPVDSYLDSNPNGRLKVSRPNSDYAPNTGELWYFFENASPYNFTPNDRNCENGNGHCAGGTSDVYGHNTAYGYWTLSPGIKTPGIVGSTQVGVNSSALAMIAADDPYGHSYEHGGFMEFMELGEQYALRPVITISSSLVRMHDEN